MHFRPLFLSLWIALLGLLLPGRAEEKGGLQINVQKVTLDKADVRGVDVNMENLDRLMGLRVSIRNVSFKDMPEGEVTWEILKRRYDTAALELTSGTEKVPKLRTGETVELTIGIVKVAGFRNGAILRKDELDWELTFKHDEKETARFSSKSNFPMLLKRATKVDPPAAPSATPALAAPSATPAPATAPAKP